MTCLMAGTPNSGKSDPPDSPQRNPLIDGNVSRSSSSNYHNPPSSTPASPPSPSPMDVVHSPPPPSDQTIKTLDRISSLELALVRPFPIKTQVIFTYLPITLLISVFEFHLLQHQATRSTRSRRAFRRKTCRGPQHRRKTDLPRKYLR